MWCRGSRILFIVSFWSLLAFGTSSIETPFPLEHPSGEFIDLFFTHVFGSEDILPWASEVYVAADRMHHSSGRRAYGRGGMSLRQIWNTGWFERFTRRALGVEEVVRTWAGAVVGIATSYRRYGFRSFRYLEMCPALYGLASDESTIRPTEFSLVSGPHHVTSLQEMENGTLVGTGNRWRVYKQALHRPAGGMFLFWVHPGDVPHAAFDAILNHTSIINLPTPSEYVTAAVTDALRMPNGAFSVVGKAIDRDGRNLVFSWIVSAHPTGVQILERREVALPQSFERFRPSLQPDGKILVAAARDDHRLMLHRYHSNLRVDGEFGVGGLVSADTLAMVAASPRQVRLSPVSNRLSMVGTWGSGSRVAYLSPVDGALLNEVYFEHASGLRYFNSNRDDSGTPLPTWLTCVQAILGPQYRAEPI